MVKYKIEIKKSAYKKLKSIPKKDLKRILTKIESHIYVYCVLDGRRDLEDLLQERLLR